MVRKIILVLFSCLIIASFFLQPRQQIVNAQTNPQYALYLPLIIKDRGQTLFGVEVGSFDDSIADKAQDAQVTWIRMNGLIWSDIQPNNSSEYLWQNAAGIEQELIKASQRKLQTVLIVRSTPRWAQLKNGSYCGPIKQDKLADFARFMAEVVKRYSAPPYNVWHYELWNEPDVDPSLVPGDSVFGCWGNNNDTYYGGGYYAEMLKAVYPAVKSINPGVKIVLGGLLLDCDPRVGDGGCGTHDTKPPKFFEGVLRNNGAAYFDLISFHGYPTYNLSSSPIEAEKNFSTWKNAGGVVAGKIDYLRFLMSNYGVDKGLIHTEGALLLPNGKTPEDVGVDAYQQAKADYVVWLYARNWVLDIKGTTWYTLNGPGWRYGGLLDANQNPLPAYNALKYMTERLNDYKYSKEITLENGVFGFEFIKGNTKIWIVFTPDNNARTINKPAGFSEALDPFGNAVTSTDTTITITRPTYIVFNP